MPNTTKVYPKAIDLAKAWYLSPAAGLLAPDFECLAVGYPTSGTIYTRAAGMLHDFFGEISAKYETWTPKVDRMIDAGEDVTVIGSYVAKPYGGPSITAPFVHVWTSQEGLLKHVTCCTDVR